jgi:hypothetical protein
VTGRGSIRAVQPDDAHPATRPRPAAALAAWRSLDPAGRQAAVHGRGVGAQAEMDGANNRITVLGPVRVSSTAADETVNAATRAGGPVIELADRPHSATGWHRLTRRCSQSDQPARGVAVANAGWSRHPGAKPLGGPAARAVTRHQAGDEPRPASPGWPGRAG